MNNGKNRPLIDIETEGHLLRKWNEMKMKWKTMKWNIFFFSKMYIILLQFEVTPENETETTYILPDIHDKNKWNKNESSSIINASS